MYSLAHYAVLGSLIAGAAGALVLVAVAFTHTLTWRNPSGAPPKPEDRARRQRVVRLADTFALLCFAVCAGLAIVGVMHHTRAVTLAGAVRDADTLLERLETVETRLARVELERQALGRAAPDPAIAEDRLARLERRIDGIEGRATVVPPRATPKARPARTTLPASVPAERVIEAQPAHIETPPRALPAPAPAPSEGAALPEAATTASPELSATTPPSRATSAWTAVVAPSAAPAPEVAPPPPASAKADAGDRPRSVGDQLRRDWEDLKRNVEGEWREALNQVKRMLRP